MVQPTQVVARVLEVCDSISFDNSPFRDDRKLGTAPVDRPGIIEASRHFTLNRKQHYAFVLVASAILMCLLQRIEPETLSIEE